MRLDKKSLLFMGGIVSVAALWLFAIGLVACAMTHRYDGMVWYGIGTMAAGVAFKTIFDYL